MISYCVAITIFCLVCFEAVAWTWWRFKKMHFIWVSMCLAQKCYLGSLFLRLLTETGPPFFVVIRATRRSSRLQYRGVPSFLSYFKTLSAGPALGSNPRLPALQLSIILSCFDLFLLSIKDGVWKGGSNFWVCGQNAVLWPFKLYLSASTVTWLYLFFQHLQNGIWKFCRTMILTTSGGETVIEHWSRVGNNLSDETHPLLEITRDKTRQDRNPRRVTSS